MLSALPNLKKKIFQRFNALGWFFNPVGWDFFTQLEVFFSRFWVFDVFPRWEGELHLFMQLGFFAGLGVEQCCPVLDLKKNLRSLFFLGNTTDLKLTSCWHPQVKLSGGWGVGGGAVGRCVGKSFPYPPFG